MFVDHALQVRDRDLLIQAEIERTMTFLQDMHDLFYEADTNGNMVMTKDELTKYLQDERVCAYMAGHNLDVSDVTNMFELLDTNQSGEIELQEFVLGTSRLKGQARCLDVMRIFQCMDVLYEKLVTVQGHLDALHGGLLRPPRKSR